jgi:hypothetical protein
VTETDMDSLVPLAAQLVGTVREYGAEDVAAVLAKVPNGRYDALAVVLAAMVDPEARPSELLAWTEPAPRDLPIDHGTERGYRQHMRFADEPCMSCRRAHADLRAQRRAIHGRRVA